MTELFPEFGKYWEEDDVNKEASGQFTVHGFMNSFSEHYRNNYENYEAKKLSQLGKTLEEIVNSDPNDQSDVANAVCTCFLELIAGEKEGKRFEPYLGKRSREYYAGWL